MSKRFTITIDFDEGTVEDKFIALTGCQMYIPKYASVREMTAFAAALSCVSVEIIASSVVGMRERKTVEKAVEELEIFESTREVISQNLHRFLSIVVREDDNIPPTKL